MAKKTSFPAEWLRAVDPELLKHDNAPLFGSSPPFPWEEYSRVLAKIFEIDSLEISPGRWEWRQSDALLEALPEPLAFFPLSISAVEGELLFILPESDLLRFLTLLLDLQSPPSPHVLDRELLEGFSRFIAVEALSALADCAWDKTASPHYLPGREPYSGDSLALDLSISCQGLHAAARLALSPLFQKSWKKRWSSNLSEEALAASLGEKLSIPLQLEAGAAALSQEELKALEVGDLLLLDRCGIDPKTLQGDVTIKVGRNALFRASLEQNRLKILT